MIELHCKQPRLASLQFTIVGESAPSERSSVEDGLQVTETQQQSYHRFTNCDRKPAMTVSFVSPASSSSALLLVSCDAHLQSSCFSGQVRSPSLFSPSSKFLNHVAWGKQGSSVSLGEAHGHPQPGEMRLK